ncbi:MAG TPA: bi-domain-containing oxidoreductase [Pyrinomonadaceae bacterium]|jgi:polar amino acid transport system substrate-binding protein|nr:bi-domain-containing oxidoreductase [Pyrinomonadaceae bacterium]
MKQVLQNRKTGRPFVGEVPVPALLKGRVLVRTVASLISAGTERAAVELVSKGLVQEARQRPDLVKAVVAKVKNEGLLNTFASVRDKMAASQALGYSAAGVVAAVAEDVTEFQVGDRVACAGVGFASHAEVLSIPKNLCVRLPDDVSFESGAYGTLGAIALQGVRLAEPTLGESVVVIGLGLVGQLTVQLLKANGCRVFGLDLDQSRVSLALELGADRAVVSSEEAAKEIETWTRGYGADAVLITAATDSNQPIELAARVSRLKGRVIVVGMTGMDIPRAPFFSRELKLVISMSYGPGRYDPEYEERGQDYPLPYVRWTEKRNIESFLELIGEKRINVERLTTHRFPIAEADRAYQLISGNLQEPNLGVVLNYDPEAEVTRKVSLGAAPVRKAEKSVVVGVIGAGGYVPAMLLPHFKSQGVEFGSIATATGISAHDVGKKFGFAYAVSSADEVLDDPSINLIVIGTRHDTHAALARAALERNKHVFVEKPLALNDQQLESVLEAVAGSSAKLMVGYNRRFSPLAQRAKEFFSNRETPLSILYRVNAGRIPKEHWIQNAQEGGGRIIGEVCHFIDLMQYLTGALPISVFAESISANSSKIVDADSVFITLRFADGSNGTIAYIGEGEKGLAKERVEIFGSGKVFVLDDFRRATFYRDGREEQVTLKAQDKGQQQQVRQVCACVLEGGPAPITLDDLAATSRTTFRVLDSLRERQPFEI